MSYRIKHVADMAGVSVRTLHHYDHIGLLKAESASPAGYRLYGAAGLERLQQIMFFRELGFSLKEIKCILDNPGFDRKEALITHKRLLLEKRKRLDILIASVEQTIDALERGSVMEEGRLFDGFDESKIEEYRCEARARWGSALVDESYRRASAYTKEDWDRIKAGEREINAAIASLMDRGDPSDPEVQEWIHRHFKRINDWFYPCTREIFRGLGDLYVSDSRFKANYERVRPGMADFMREAIRIYCEK